MMLWWRNFTNSYGSRNAIGINDLVYHGFKLMTVIPTSFAVKPLLGILTTRSGVFLMSMGSGVPPPHKY